MTHAATGSEHGECDADAVASLLAALASPWRIQIVRLLAAEEELDVTQLADRLGQTVANVSAHLKRLRQAGIVISHRTGTHIGNRLASDEVSELCSQACRTLPSRRR